jgi:RHS repeat-associated protein
VTDSNGNVVRRYDYLPSGEELWAGPGGRTATMGYQNGNDGFNPKFTGQIRDTETGLDYMHFRYYSPQEGRFVSVDPGNAGANAGDPQTWNGYSYVVNNPLVYTDPSGMFLCATCIGVESGNPIGPIIGGLIDLGGLLAGLFGGGGASVPKWSDTAWELGPPLNMPGEFGDPWNENPGLGGDFGTSNSGTLFGSGNTDPFIFSVIQVQGNMNDWDVARRYLFVATAMASIIRKLEASKTVYTIHIYNSGSNSYDPNMHSIEWNSRNAATCKSGGTMSPALRLGHELAHAAGPAASSQTIGPPYDSPEERRVITGPERSAATALGECVRHEHDFPGNFNVPSPIMH